MRGRSDDSDLLSADGGDANVLEREGPLRLLDFPEKPLGFLLSFRWIPEKPDHGKIYTHLNYSITDFLRVGFDYRPITGDVDPQANLRVFPENEGWRPALILGTSNDDFGDISSQSYYGTLSKHLFEWKKFNFSPYAGATYIDELEELRPVAGLHIRRGQFSTMFSFSGVDEHLSFTWAQGNHTFTFLLFDLELPGLAWTMRF